MGNYLEITGKSYSENVCTVEVMSYDPIVGIDMWYTVYEVFVEYIGGVRTEQKIPVADNRVIIEGLYNIRFNYETNTKYIVEVGVFEDVYNGTGDRVLEDSIEFTTPSNYPPPAEEVHMYLDLSTNIQSGNPGETVIATAKVCKSYEVHLEATGTVVMQARRSPSSVTSMATYDFVIGQLAICTGNMTASTTIPMQYDLVVEAVLYDNAGNEIDRKSVTVKNLNPVTPPPGKAWIKIRVTYNDYNTPIKNATVKVNGMSSKTDDNGIASFEVQGNKNYNIEVTYEDKHKSFTAYVFEGDTYSTDVTLDISPPGLPGLPGLPNPFEWFNKLGGMEKTLVIAAAAIAGIAILSSISGRKEIVVVR